MKSKLKKSLSLLLALVMCLSLCAVPAFATEKTITFTKNSYTVTVTGETNADSGKISSFVTTHGSLPTGYQSAYFDYDTVLKIRFEDATGQNISIEDDIDSGRVSITITYNGETKVSKKITVSFNEGVKKYEHYFGVGPKSQEPTSFTITYDANGGTGTMNSQTVTSGESVALSDCAFTAPEGKVFAGWTLSGTLYQAGDTITVTGDTTLTAQWIDEVYQTYSSQIAAQNSSGGTVKIQESSGLLIDYFANSLKGTTDVTLEGESVNDTRMSAQKARIAATNFGLKGMTINASGSSCPLLIQGDGTTIENVVYNSSGGYGLELNGSDITLRNVSFNAPEYNNAVVMFTDESDTASSNYNVENVTITAGSGGLRAYSFQGTLNISDTTIHTPQGAFEIGPSRGFQRGTANISNSTFDTTVAAFSTLNRATLNNVTFKNTWETSLDSDVTLYFSARNGEFNNCQFNLAEGAKVIFKHKNYANQTVDVTFNNCTFNGTLITEENYTQFFDFSDYSASGCTLSTHFTGPVAEIGDTKYTTITEAVENAGNNVDITVNTDTTIGGVNVAANSTVTVTETANPVSSTVENATATVTPKTLTITKDGEADKTAKAYVVSKNEASTVVTDVRVATNSGITNEAPVVENLVDVAQVLANAVAANSDIDVSSISSMELSLKKTTENTLPEAVANAMTQANQTNNVAFEVHPVATVKTTVGTTTTETTYNVSNEELAANASFTFKLTGLTPDQHYTLYHYASDGTLKNTFYQTADGNGEVTLTLSSFSYIVGEESEEATDFATLVARAQPGQTIVLTDDVTLDSAVVINKNMTIDLNGHTITAANCRALWVKNGDVTITGTGTVSASGDGLAADSSVIRVGDGSANTAAAKLTIDTGVTVSSDKSYVITVFGLNDDSDASTDDIVLTVDGNVVSTVAANTAADAAISGNGTSKWKATAITINGSVTSDNTYAIYHPGKGALTVNGTVRGLGGIEAKGGTVTINSGAEVEATAGTQAHNVYGNGPSTSGYAIAAVNNTGYTANPATVNITGGTITGKAAALADQETIAIGTVTASSNDIPVDDGCMWVSDENGGYKLAAVVATIGETKYASLKDAVDTATAGQTVKLESNVVLSETVAVTKNLTIDMNGHNISSNVNGTLFTVDCAKLTFTGTGTIDTSAAPGYGQTNGKYYTIIAKGSKTSTDTGYGVVLGADVSVRSNGYAVQVANNEGYAYGVTVDIYSKSIDATYGVTVNGGITATSGNIPVVNFYSGANMAGMLYAAGYAQYNIENGVSITSDEAAVEIRAGELNISGGTFTATTNAAYTSTANGSGSTTAGAAIAVAQHNTGKLITVNITGGTFNGSTALGIANPQGNNINTVEGLDISVTGGTFNATYAGASAVTVNDSEPRASAFIALASNGSSPTFNTAISGELCNEGFEPKENGDGTYGVQEVAEFESKLSDKAWNEVAWIHSANLTLLDTIQLNAYLYVPSKLSSTASYVTVTFDGTESAPMYLNTLDKDDEGYYAIHQKVYAMQMDYSIVIKLYDTNDDKIDLYQAKWGNNTWQMWTLDDEVFTTSVNIYLDKLAASMTAEVNNDTNSAEQKAWAQAWYDFAIATKEYGAKAAIASDKGLNKPTT